MQQAMPTHIQSQSESDLIPKSSTKAQPTDWYRELRDDEGKKKRTKRRAKSMEKRLKKQGKANTCKEKVEKGRK